MQAEEEWRSKLEERDGQVEDLQGRLWEAERAQGVTEDKLKTVRKTSDRSDDALPYAELCSSRIDNRTGRRQGEGARAPLSFCGVCATHVRSICHTPFRLLSPACCLPLLFLRVRVPLSVCVSEKSVSGIVLQQTSRLFFFFRSRNPPTIVLLHYAKGEGGRGGAAFHETCALSRSSLAPRGVLT